MKLFLKRSLFYILSFTWGGLMSFIGLFVILGAMCFGGKPFIYHGRLGVQIGKNRWGGLELGCFFLVGYMCEDCSAHEAGHGLQNIIWGPLFPIVIGIPSAIRYWYFEWYEAKHEGDWPCDYDAIWFEGQATRWGKKFIETDKL